MNLILNSVNILNFFRNLNISIEFKAFILRP